ncbi:hypothetical protein HDU93_007613 [Gonapodya sp. JEL0774]|nr:hypothetical protein HDU93_007613 [Gonapodya sp. JEL0774]
MTSALHAGSRDGNGVFMSTDTDGDDGVVHLSITAPDARPLHLLALPPELLIGPGCVFTRVPMASLFRLAATCSTMRRAVFENGRLFSKVDFYEAQFEGGQSYDAVTRTSIDLVLHLAPNLRSLHFHACRGVAYTNAEYADFCRVRYEQPEGASVGVVVERDLTGWLGKGILELGLLGTPVVESAHYRVMHGLKLGIVLSFPLWRLPDAMKLLSHRSSNSSDPPPTLDPSPHLSTSSHLRHLRSISSPLCHPCLLSGTTTPLQDVTVFHIVDQTGVLNGAKFSKVKLSKLSSSSSSSSSNPRPSSDSDSEDHLETDSDDNDPLHRHDGGDESNETRYDPAEDAIRESLSFSSIVFAVPLAITEATFHHIIISNFNLWTEWTMFSAIFRSLGVYAFLVALIYFTHARKEETWMQVVLAGLASSTGCAMVHFAEVDRSSEAALMGSRVAVVWIYCIIQSGGTERLAKRLADGLQVRALSHPEYGTTDLVNIANGTLPAGFNWKRYKALALAIPFYSAEGASSKVTHFLIENLGRINSIPFALLIISLTPLGNNYTQESDRGLKTFLRATGLKPRIVKVVPGHIPWTQLSFLDKIRVRKILGDLDDKGWNPKYVKKGDNPSDTKLGDREYTNLNEIDDVRFGRPTIRCLFCITQLTFIFFRYKFARDFVVEAQEHYEAKSSKDDLFTTKGRGLYAVASEDD